MRADGHQVRAAVAGAGRWLVWHPWRLVVALALLFVLWVVSVSLRDEEAVPVPPDPTITAPGGVQLPEGWQTWPSVTATHAPDVEDDR